MQACCICILRVSHLGKDVKITLYQTSHRHINADHPGDGHGDGLLNRAALLPSHLATVVLVPSPHLSVLLYEAKLTGKFNKLKLKLDLKLCNANFRSIMVKGHLPDLLSLFVDCPKGCAVSLGHVLAIVDGLVVVLHHHLLRAVLQSLRLDPHGRVHALLHRPVHRAVCDQLQLR